ncbi:NUDIX domain-containing protein [Hydrogenophaga sp. PAMC20947]|nr:NUDIX domain-containing protein [Hydrogenophaga sp. PAMC20947]
MAALPLISVDWVLIDPAGAVLCGLRLNAPARGAWFTPGGRVHKGEALAAALLRVAMVELGASRTLASNLIERAQLMGAWDHFYADSAFSEAAATHYVNLPYWAPLTWSEVEALMPALPVGEQHSAWRWVPWSANAGELHEHVAPYLAWVGKAFEAGAKGSAA